MAATSAKNKVALNLADSPYISTADAATALGVSVSTVKRWVDENILPAHRTAGGHRKLLRAEVTALSRQGKLPQADLAPLIAGGGGLESEAQVLAVALLRGDLAGSKAILRRTYDSGIPVETFADQVVAPAMHKVGAEWETARIDVWHEHRATLLVLAALHELQVRLEPRAERSRRVALGGSAPGDPYQLPTMLAQLVLMDAGWDAVNLGANTPFESFIDAVKRLRPRLVWLSASHLEDEKKFLANYRQFYQAAERAGAAVIVGGRALSEKLRAGMPYTAYGDGMAHLAAFAHTLHPRPRRPQRGRPPKT
jgi:excisionase family DNA binding protein